jgi:hypothetical protein
MFQAWAEGEGGMIAAIDWVTFLLKLLLVPTFISIVSVAGRRWGPTVSGWLIGLPLTSGPVAFFLALEQGTVFASEASRGIMLGIISVFVFCLVYSRLAIHLKWTPSLLGALVSYFALTYLLDASSPSLLIGFASILVILVASLALMPSVKSGKTSATIPRWEIPARMISATALVFIITGVAQLLGPQLTGLLTPFPVYLTILVVFIHRLQGGGQAVRLLRGVVAGSLTFAVFFLVISTTILPWGVGASFIAAICIGLVTHACSFQFLKRPST